MVVKKELLIAVIVSILFTISFAFASHIITTSTGTTSYNVNEDVSFIYNISINNTDEGALANITQVDVIIPGSFFLDLSFNGTDTFGAFSNTSTVLTWINSTYLINGTNGTVLKYFWFNLTGANPGNYNLTIVTVNSTGSHYSNISVVVNDSTKPVITLQSPSDAYSSIVTSVNFAYTVSDYSPTNCSLILDGVITNINLSVDIVGAGNTFTNTTSVANHSWSINCTDIYGNYANSSIRSFIIRANTTNETSTSDTSLANTIGNWVVTYTISSTEFTNGFVKELAKNNRAKFSLNNTDKYVGVLTVSNTSIGLEISNNTDSIFNVLDLKKFDLNGDGYYDISIKLESIATSKARLTMKQVYEKIGAIVNSTVTANSTVATNSVSSLNVSSNSTKVSETAKVDKSNILFWIVLGIIIVLISMVIVAFFIVRNNKKNPYGKFR